MSAVLAWPLGIVLFGQVFVWGFFAGARCLGLDSPETRLAFLVIGMIVFAISAVIGGVAFADMLPEYQREQRQLRERREREMAALDAEIGIPRIPQRRP